MIDQPPLGIDLFCGLGGWTEGLLAEGYYVVGFDNERHIYGEHRYPGQLVVQDVLTLHGRQFAGAALIVASPPCQEYSYRAMPWKRAKALPPPSNELFDACFRIQAEACAAAGHHIPMVVENVRGAQKYVGRARWNFGSFYLWGDVPALMPMRAPRGLKGGWLSQANGAPMRRDDGNKVSGQSWSNYAKTGVVSPHWRMQALGEKVGDQNTHRQGKGPSPHFTNAAEGTKHHGSGAAWFDTGPASYSSKSSKRKAASALIAKIPLTLSRHIAAAWKPTEQPKETNP